MQVMPFWAGHFGYGTDALFDPQVNLEIAAWIRDQRGWNAWSPYVRGSCR
jgi:soluble lytic murein transglycosylase-like protein